MLQNVEKSRHTSRRRINLWGKRQTVIGAAVALGTVATMAIPSSPAFASGGGFNSYGYNYSARIFNGTASSWCQAFGNSKASCDAMVYPYQNDQLIMKWNAAWDACNANGWDNPTYCAGAWVTNEWNGIVPNGSQVTEHVKIIWVGSAGMTSTYWRADGYLIWGNCEAIQDQGMADHIRYVNAFAVPNGLA